MKMRESMIRLAAVLIIAAITACSSTPPSPEPSSPELPQANALDVLASQGRFGAIVIHVRDESGLADAAGKLENAQGVLGSADVAAVADPVDNNLAISWVGGVCRFGPTVTLTGTQGLLHVRVNPDAGKGLPPGVACDAIGVFYGITLHLTVPIEQENVRVELLR
jgi:hypothetical protein